MATRAEGHIFAKPRTKYPWSQWTDGTTWRIVKGVDYTISTYNMQISLHGRAKTQGIKVRSESFEDRAPDDNGWPHNREGLVFQYYEKSPDA